MKVEEVEYSIGEDAEWDWFIIQQKNIKTVFLLDISIYECLSNDYVMNVPFD